MPGTQTNVSNGPDLTHFVQHRQLDIYEQGMARQGYAYGVDLRRSRWLASSTVGNVLVRAVDRAWPQLARHLLDEAVVPLAHEGRPVPIKLLRELSEHTSLLRAPVPAVRLLRPEQRGRWPLVTALGATHGGSLWLVLDVDSLLALEPDKRAFLLGAGLGHLHCEHAVFFSAHLLAGRREGNSSIRALQSVLTPWTRVMMFSADRAGLLACGRLETAVSVIENPPVPIGDDPDPSWMPPPPKTAMRIQALEEFARSAVFARVQAMRARQRELVRAVTLSGGPGPDGPFNQGQAPADAKPAEPEQIHVPANAWSLARVDTRLTHRLNLL
ncbi:hypothetical protein DB30_06681 [Enhygromyxa salina]|uniref:Peptidase M48 domain-containing protein n=1 Tax=Enhygromyxa salina TaxID=215803 RepID=A0A0C1ZU00_9BACT|nr:hypothetical protein [Enhygromyxa salina]KIG14533.1 hypothetical protein DB30_06681 [Enhygromyxa salina]